MAEQFNEKEGLMKTLKTALRNDNFIMAVFNMIFGDENAAKEVEFGLKKASQENTLNEMVAVHRFFKGNLDESKLGKVRDLLKARGLFKKIGGLRGKSVDFYRKVLVRTLKKPGQMLAFMYIVKAIVTLGYPLDDIIAMPVTIKFFISLLETASEVAEEEEEQPSINEQAIINKLRRSFRHASHKKQINEEIEDRYGGRMPVNVYTGRFQPFHLGHLSNLQEAAKRGLRTVICPVMAGKTAKSIAAHPFNGEVEKEMFARLKSTYGGDLIADIIPVSKPTLDCWVEAIRKKGMEPITWTTGTDRLESYQNLVKTYGPNFNLDKNFEVIGLEKNVGAGGGSSDDKENIEGRAVRECLMNDDKEGFMRQMPKCLWDMYDAFRQALMPAQQTITESVAYRNFKRYLNKGLNELLK